MHLSDPFQPYTTLFSTSDSARLPSYHSHHEMYHPFPYPVGAVDLGETVDDRYDEVLSRTSFALSIVPGDSNQVQNLDVALNGRDVHRRRIGFVELVIDFALAMRRRLRSTKRT